MSTSIDSHQPPPPSPHHKQQHPLPSAPPLDTSTQQYTGASSPVAPAYSPITPKVQPVLPAKIEAPFLPPDSQQGDFTFTASHVPQSQQQKPQTSSSIAPTQYIPQPPSLPFSSEDATDAIALRAAISTLQFQKKKAKEDLKALQDIKQLALDDPAHFKTELAAGRLNETRPKLGDLRAILDESDSEDEDEGAVTLGATRDEEPLPRSSKSPSKSDSSTADKSAKSDTDITKRFPPIPGPQSVVRMPPINWDKYGIVGEPLERMHAQQRRWPGSSTDPGQDKGREHTIAAPYSPFLDILDTTHNRTESDGSLRKDSAAASSTTPGGTISEHPMETRSRA